MDLYSYFRSSASYRVRIALQLKGVTCNYRPINLVENEQMSEEYRARNTQGLVPALVLDSGDVIGQSVAILEWLEESHPEPSLYPQDPIERAQMRSLCQHIACDVHPLNNLRVLRYLKDRLGQSQDSIGEWYAHWVHTGFDTLEPLVAAMPAPFSLGDRPGMLEVMIVPQVYNARRFEVLLEDYPAICGLDERCASLDAFARAHPSRQPDTPDSERA
jgi:maleylacetoacetate isomerase